MPLVGVKIGPRPVVISITHARPSRPHLISATASPLGSGVANLSIEPGPAKELRGHLGVRVESSLHQHRNSMVVQAVMLSASNP